MGLFDGILDNPQAMGLLAMGANMLANNGTRPYGTVWQSLGDGLLGGMQTAQTMKQQQQEQAWKQRQQAMQEQEYALKNQELQAKLNERANEAKRMEMFKSSPGALGFGLPLNAPQARQLLEQGGGEDLNAINEGLNSIDPNGGIPVQAPRLGVFGQAATMQGLPPATVAQLKAQQAAADAGAYPSAKEVNDTLDRTLQFGIGLADKQEARAQAEQIRRDLAEQQMALRRDSLALRQDMHDRDRPKLSPGERFRPDGSVELIPGSSQYLKQKDKHANDKGAVDAVKTKTQHAIEKINSILSDENKSAFESNFGGYNAYATRLLPGNTQNVKNTIESLKSDLKAAGLELMRAGGSIGQMTEREWPIVEQMIAKIDPKLGEKEAREELKKVAAYLEKIASNAEFKYSEEWSGSQFSQPSKQPSVKRKTINGRTFENDGKGWYEVR